MEELIPIFLFFVTGVVIALWLITRHRERLAMLDKGLSAEDIKSLYQRSNKMVGHPLTALKWGFILVAVGLAVIVGLYVDHLIDIDEVIYPGLIALFGGLALVRYYDIAKKQLKEQ